MKKMMLVALAAVSALLALPAFASANPPLHITKAEAFSVHGGASTLSRTDGLSTSGTTTTGSGTFENTTTGTVTLTFTGVESAFGKCNSAGQAAGTVVTTKLPFHLTTLDSGKPGILLTPALDASGNPHFASYSCTIFANIVVRGNGILGEITSPECGKASTTATLKFTGAAGVQTPNTYTGVTTRLQSSLNGGALVNSAMNAEAKITFGSSQTLTCT